MSDLLPSQFQPLFDTNVSLYAIGDKKNHFIVVKGMVFVSLFYSSIMSFVSAFLPMVRLIMYEVREEKYRIEYGNVSSALTSLGSTSFFGPRQVF